MAQEATTIRELNHVISGLRTEVRLYVAGFVVALGVFGYVANSGFSKLDDLESKIDNITGKLDAIASDTSQIKENTSVASFLPSAPTEGAFQGWIGVKGSEDTDLVPALRANELKDAWIYLPSDRIDDVPTGHTDDN